jgi:hypothetical protein
MFASGSGAPGGIKRLYAEFKHRMTPTSAADLFDRMTRRGFCDYSRS